MATLYISFEHEEEASTESDAPGLHITEIAARKLKVSNLRDRHSAINAIMDVARSRLGLRVTGDSTVGNMTVAYDTEKWISQQKAIEIVTDAIKKSQANAAPPATQPRVSPLDVKKKGRR